MTGVPAPPEAWWTGVPWWAGLGFMFVALVVVVVVGPWMIQRTKGAPSAILSREQSVATREAAAQARADAELAEVKADALRGWDLARGWAAMAHTLWHDLRNAAQRANDARRVLLRVLEGKLSIEAAREVVAGWDVIQGPDPLPDVDAVEPKKPGETKYA